VASAVRRLQHEPLPFGGEQRGGGGDGGAVVRRGREAQRGDELGQPCQILPLPVLIPSTWFGI
jgi:hypothetical protein